MTKDNKKIQILFILSIFFIVFYAAALNGHLPTPTTNDLNTFEQMGELKTSTTFFDVVIDDTSANNWTWAKDQGYCTGSGTSIDPYIIENHEFRIDLTNVTLSITNSDKYFVIRNCRFEGYSNGTGIFMKNVSNALLQESVFSNLYNCLISYNLNNSSLNMVYFEFSVNGLDLKGCSNNTFQQIQCYQLDSKAYNFKNCTQNQIIENDIQQCVNGISFDSSSYNEIKTTVIYNINNGVGIHLKNSHYNIFTETTSLGNQYGIILLNSSHNQITLCQGSDNNGTGILSNSSHYNNFTGTGFSNNNGIGLKMFDSHNNIVKDCDAYNNSLTGIDLEYCFNNTIEENTILLSQLHGISLSYCIDNTITENIVKDSERVGISLTECINNRVMANYLTISGVEGDGISLLYSVGNLIISNDVWGNSDPDHLPHPYCPRFGIHVEFGAYNIIFQNDISNHLNGIFLNNSFKNYLIRNTVSHEYQGSYKGIFLKNSDENFIVENILVNFVVLEVHYCIVEENCQDNVILDNQCSTQDYFLEGILINTLIYSSIANVILGLLFLRKKMKIRRGIKSEEQ